MAYPLRFAIYLPTSPNFQSPFIWMGAFYGVYLVFLILELIAHMRNKESKAGKILAVLAIVFGVAASSNLGAVFGTMPGREYWTVPFLPLFFICTALLTGAAALIVLTYFTKKDMEARDGTIQYLGEMLVLFIGATLFFNVWNIVGSFIGQSPERYEALMFLLTGDLAVSFWAFEIGLGLI